MKTQSLPTCGVFTAALFILAAATLQSPAQAVSDYVDEFTGPTLDARWRQLNPASGATFDGFIGGGYQISYPGSSVADTGLEISLDGTTNNPGVSVTNSFTIDNTVKITNLSGQTGFFKFRFFGGQFMEVVYSHANDDLRVYSAEAGGNLVANVPVGLGGAGGVLNLRLSRDVATGTVVVGYSAGAGTPLQVLASVSGLVNFTPYKCDIVMNKGGLPVITPVLLIDRYEQRDGVFGVTLDPFTDTFGGPSLDSSWTTVGDEQVGFIGGGLYEVQKTNTVGEAGLSRDFGGEGTFNSSIKFQMQDFNGSESQVEFRSPTPSGGITVTLNSANDIIVTADATTVAELTDFGYQDGESLEIVIAEDTLTGDAQVGLRRNGGTLLRLAILEGLSAFATNAQIVVIKNAAGNGNSPRLQLDEYSIAEGFKSIDAPAFSDDFTGPTLDPEWFVSDSGVGSQVGFNGMGQYEISPQGASVTAGLRRFLGMASDVTIDLRARLSDFSGSDSECRLEIPGLNGVSVIIKSDGTLEVFSAETSSTILSTPSGISDGDLFDLRLTADVNSTNGVYEVGLGINGAPLTFLVDDFNLLNLDPVQVQVLITKNGVGNGNNPVLLLDRVSINEGFNLIPEVAEAFSTDFSFDAGGWTPTGLTHLGITNGQQYFIRVDTNAPVSYTRLLAPSGIPGIPVGSFTMLLDVQFLQLAGTNSPGAGTDCKIKIEGGNLMEIVFNSFKSVRFYTAGNGNNWFNGTLTQFNDGDTVNFGIVYDASAPSVTMSVGLNGGPAIFKETRSGLVGVAPQILNINGFRFNFDNYPALVPQFALDQLDIDAGVTGVPGTLTIGDAYGGRIQLEWDAGKLQSAPAVGGPYSDVPMVTSPYLQLPTAGQEYFRTEN